jgi:hypothetical protein
MQAAGSMAPGFGTPFRSNGCGAVASVLEMVRK